MEEFIPVWYTIPSFENIVPENPCHKEQEKTKRREFPAENLHVLARADFCVLNHKTGYKLRISGDDYYKVYINGSFAGQGPAPSWPEHYYYNETDITPYLKPGKNVLAVHLYYQGLVNRVWNSGDGRLALAGEVTGETETIPLLWKYRITKAYTGKVTGYDTQFLEDFDSRIWEEDWNLPTFDDSGWQSMVRAEWADYHMEKQPVGMLEVYTEKPEKTEKKGNVWFVDVGHEVTGSLVIKARGTVGKKVVITCGEEKGEDGSVRYDMRCGCCYREIWTLDEGVCTLEPYDYKGFCYAEIKGEEGVEILDVQVRIRHYPMDDTLCTLETDYPLNGIFSICKNAVKYGTQEAYLDCPTREKGQYLGDAIITSRSQVWLTGKTDMLRKCIRQFEWTASVCPGLMAVMPGSFMQEIADFSLLYPQLLMTDYEFTGDREFLREHCRIVRDMLLYFAGYEDESGLLNQVRDKWNLVDWPENLRDRYDFDLSRPVVGKGCHNVINALYAGAIKSLCEMEKILDLPSSFSFEKVRERYIQTFYRPDKRLFADSSTSSHFSLHSNLYALYFGLVPKEAVEYVADYLEEKGLACGVMTSYYLLKALAGAGRYEAVYRLLTNQGEHGWVNMLQEDASCCFEAWGKEQKWNTSLCHPWASGPVSILIEEIAGIHLNPVAEEGYDFRPHIPDCLTQFSMKVPLGNKILYVRNEGGKYVISEDE